MYIFNRQNLPIHEAIQEELGAKWKPVQSLVTQNYEWAQRVQPVSGLITPPVDIVEDNERFLVNVELPGFVSEDIIVEITQRQVSVSAEKRRHQNENEGKIQRFERGFGIYKRDIAFPVAINPSTAQAAYDNGVLALKLPKTRAASIQPISIEFLN